MANKTAKEKNKPVRKTLRENEYYNPKTKRYEYRYKDGFGKSRVVSSYRLEPTDQVPKGKRSGKSLREKEAEINALLSNDIDIDGSKLTLLEVVNRYLEHLYNRKELSHNTKTGYNVTVNTLKQYKLGYMEIGTKTSNGIRYIPMTDGVYNCFQSVIDNRYLKGDIEPVCYDERGNAYEGFVFLATRSRKTIVRAHVEEYLQNCIKRYNLANPDAPIRKFEPHICRHTFATNMQGLPLKTLQSILGHGNVRTTMNHYVDARPSNIQVNEINIIANSIGNS